MDFHTALVNTIVHVGKKGGRQRGIVGKKGGCTNVRMNYSGASSIAATLGEQHFGRYIGVAFIEVLFCTQIVHLGHGCLAVIQKWPLFRGGR